MTTLFAEKSKKADKNAQPHKKSRIWEMDFLRGLFTLLMIFDHVMVLTRLVFIPQWAATSGAAWIYELDNWLYGYFNSNLRSTTWVIVVTGFVFISGISSFFSKNNLLRGLKLAAVCVAITVVTFFFNKFAPDTQILFGVIHMYAASLIIFGLLEEGLKRAVTDKDIYKIMSIFMLVALGVIMILLGNTYSKIAPYTKTGIGELFFYSREFQAKSADYFPILPWCGVLFLGAAFGTIFYEKKTSLLGTKLNGTLNKATAPINFVGRKALWFYVLHQVAAFALLSILGLFI